MKARRTGGRPLTPKIMWSCHECGQVARGKWGTVGINGWRCLKCFWKGRG